MLKKILFVSALAIFFIACNEDSSDVKNNNDTTIVADTEMQEINLSDFEAKAGDFVGKEVKVSGIVDHVCRHGGKKILLVDGDNRLHIVSNERFDEALSGSKISVVGIVDEERIDSAYLAEKLKHEEGSYGEDTEENRARIEEMKEWVNMMMDSLKSEGVEYFSNFSLEYVSHEESK